MSSKLNIGDYIFDPTCGEDGFIVGLSSDGETAVIQYLTENGPEEDEAACVELEKSDRPTGTFDIEDACKMCGYLHHANSCTIRPGEYCKRRHQFKEVL